MNASTIVVLFASFIGLFIGMLTGEIKKMLGLSVGLGFLAYIIIVITSSTPLCG
jgi:hypothetical protein